MRIGHTSDKIIDQSEIESKYLWNFLPKNSKAIQRINLATKTIDSSQTLKSPPLIRHSITLPNNKIFGIVRQVSNNRLIRYLFISDENLNIKLIDIPYNQAHESVQDYFASCFYDDSIFTFEHDENLLLENCNELVSSKRYIISLDKWSDLITLNKLPLSCIGFKQKIIIIVNSPEIWVYDILLNSYSWFNFRNSSQNFKKIMLKNQGKLYMIKTLKKSDIYVTDDPFSEWTFVCDFQKCLNPLIFANHTQYKGSIYCLSNQTIYEFNLKQFKLKEVASLASLTFSETFSAKIAL